MVSQINPITPFYSDERTIRLRHGFHDEHIPSKVSGDQFSLPEVAYGILVIQKNGIDLPVAQFTHFSGTKSITLSTPASQGDVFYIVYSTKLPEETLIEVLEHATDVIDSFLSDEYGETRIAEWKRYNFNHGAVTGGPFVVNDVLTGSSSGATATVVSVDATTLVVLPLNGRIFHLGETITGSISAAFAVLDNPGGINPEVPPIITKLATQIAACFAWQAFWDKNHIASSDLMDANFKKLEMYYAELEAFQKNKKNIPGESRKGTRSKPSIGRATKQIFRKDLDLEDTDYLDFSRATKL